jgi:DNA-binding NtrC family response regulator
LSTPNLKLLILDDEDTIRDCLVDFFVDNGYQAQAASSAEAAINLLEQNDFEAAIVDIRLGAMNGDAFISEAHKLSKSLVFVICTGSPDYEIPHELLDLPQVSSVIFSKPVTDLNPLLEEIRKLVELNASCQPGT